MELVHQHSQFNMGGRDVKTQFKILRAYEDRLMYKYRKRAERIQKIASGTLQRRLHLTWALNDK